MVASVKYVGPDASKTVSAAKWLQMTGEVVSATTWDSSNSWSLPASGFTAAQLRYLESNRFFVTTEGTRPVDFVPVDGIPDNIQEYLENKLLAASGTYARFSVSQGGLYVDPVDGSDSNDGLSPGAARLTAQTALAELAPVGGVLHLLDGTHAALTIDSTTAARKGVEVRGLGPLRTVVSGGITVLSGGGATTPQFLVFEALRLTGTGHGLNLGGDNWRQMGNIRARDLHIDRMTGDGIRAYDINDSQFENIRVEDCGGRGVRVTGRSTDGTGVVERGNTNVFLNVALNGNAAGGWLFDDVGNCYLVVGGETNDHPTGKYGIEVVPGANTAQLRFLGVHMERNYRNVLLGDGVTDLSLVEFDSCHFNGQINASTEENVKLNRVRQVVFRGCMFAGLAGMAQIKSAYAGDRFVVDECRTTGPTIPLVELSSGTQYAKVYGRAVFGGPSSRVIQNSSTSDDDTFGAAPEYVETARALPALIRKVKTLGGTTEEWHGNGSPEGVVTAPVGSVYRRLNGGVGTTQYVKETGTGNTGWQAVGAAGPMGPTGPAGGLQNGDAIRSMWRSGAVIRPPGGAATGAITNNALQVFPVFVPYNGGVAWTLAELGVDVSVAAVGTAPVYRFMVYGPHASTPWHPGALLGEAVSEAIGATGVKRATGLSISIPDDTGVIYIGGAVQGAETTNPTLRVISGQPWSLPSPTSDMTTTARVCAGLAKSTTDTSGSAPASFPATTACTVVANPPRVHFLLA